MKLRHILAAALTAFVIGSSAKLHAQETESEKTPLGLKMKSMNTAYKAMGRAITAGESADALKQAKIVID